MSIFIGSKHNARRVFDTQHRNDDPKGVQYSCIVVTGNWRITFKFENGDAYILNYEDYH